MDKAPLISIIVPIYNSTSTLKTCVNSILQQTFEDYELLLVDDGSVDDSFELCKQYERMDARVHIFRKKNGGVSSARNFGIGKASGQFLFFMDSDDYIPKEYLYHMISVINNSEEKIQTVSAMTKFSAEDELPMLGIRSLEEHKLERRDILKIYLEGLLNSPCNKFFRREIVLENEIYFPEEVSLGEDLLFNIAYEQVNNVSSYVVLRDVKYYYRQGNEKSLSHRFYLDYFETQNTQYKSLEQLAHDVEAPEEDIRLLKERYGLFLFLTLKYNMRKDNPKRFWQKMQDNSKILQLEAFQEWIQKHQSQYKPFVVRIYLSRNYFWVWCLQRMLNIYTKIRYKERIEN